MSHAPHLGHFLEIVDHLCVLLEQMLQRCEALANGLDLYRQGTVTGVGLRHRREVNGIEMVRYMRGNDGEWKC